MRYFAALTALPLILAAPLAERAEAVGPNKYIVVLKSTAPAPIKGTVGLPNKLAGNVLANVNKEHIYDVGNFKGYSATLNDAQIAALRLDPNVSVNTFWRGTI
jgi:Peptidase inhibitor I9